jgi:tRNA pseudouridine55 synthase
LTQQANEVKIVSHNKRQPKDADQFHGLLLVDKPGMDDQVSGDQERLPTSHDVVQRVRRFCSQQRIGHTGTLDPMASGLMVLCMGGATRLVEYYQGHDKRYIAHVTLGRATDTYDALGETTQEAAVPDVDEHILAQVLTRFQGDILQCPPIYSALKQGGESLHRKARRGEEVIVTPRPVTIYQIELLDWSPPHVRLYIHCSAGTYVRSLAHDLGHALGSAGHLSYLRRESVGHFRVEQAHTLAQIEAACRANSLADLLLPPADGLSLPLLTADPEIETRLGHGQTIWVPLSALAPLEANQQPITLQVVDTQGRFLGIAAGLRHAADGQALLCKADKWLVSTLYGAE